MSLLESIYSPSDLRALSDAQQAELCNEIRAFLVERVSKTGGHLASNLGVVELTVALHRVFDTSRDRLVFDVGHQSYVHKILTGRMAGFDSLRRFGGLSGFPKPGESVHDAFIAGHASNSISVALGMARARTMSRRDFSVIAVIGDGALTGGLAYEALSDAGASGEPMIVILNDNGMSITKNVGGVSRYLSRQRLRPSYTAFKKKYRRAMEVIPGGRFIYKITHGVKTAVKNALLHCSMFEEMGLQYVGPVDGHNIKQIAEALTWAKKGGGPVLVHVITRKGKGYTWSEKSPDKYHGVGTFDAKTGLLPPAGRTFSAAFGDAMEALGKEEPRLVAITAAMADGTGLTGFARRYPTRFFDVGIAEGHAVSMAAGLAAMGATPVFAVYSTFLQRAYDMLLHDVGISRLHVVLAVDRAGLVGGDGETHQGVFDVAYLSSVPNMRIYCPASYRELYDMLRQAVLRDDGPVAIRYPRGAEGAYQEGGAAPVRKMTEGADYTLVTYGTMINTALAAAQMLKSADISVEVIKLGRIAPMEYEEIAASVEKTGGLLVLEEAVARGGVGERISAELLRRGIFPESLILKNLGEAYIPCGSYEELCRFCGLDAESIRTAIAEAVTVGKSSA